MKPILKNSLIKATLGATIFVLIYLLTNLEFVRAKIEDRAFDILNNISLTSTSQDTHSPHVLVFKIDKHYLTQHQLLDKNNGTNYGYLFPRDKIADFIESIDSHIKKLSPEHQPKVLFIDYDLSYPSTNTDTLSKQDKKLFATLKQPRDYTILLPKTFINNFILDSKDTEIQQLIKNGKIRFVSVGMKLSKDNISRRYDPYSDPEKPPIIPSAVITAWKIAQNKPINIQEIQQDFKYQTIIENRILFKDYKKNKPKNDNKKPKKYIRQTSYWSKLSAFSANYPLGSIPDEHFKHAVIMLGPIHEESKDIFSKYDLVDEEKISGIDMHANALMTLFYFDGTLRKINLIFGAGLVFGIIFLINCLGQSLIPLQGKAKIWNSLIFLVPTTIIMFGLSWIFLHYHFWFNWVIPILVFKIMELKQPNFALFTLLLILFFIL